MIPVEGIDADARQAEPQAGFARPAQPGAASAPRLHPIVELGYRVRVPAHLCTLVLLASSFANTGAPAGVWASAVFYGLAWPHLARWLAVHSRRSKQAELRNLLIDSAVVGAFAAFSGFSLWPSVVLVTGINSASLSVGGAAFALRAFAVCLASAAVVSAAQGFRFTPEADLLTSVIGALSILAYTAIFSYRTHFEAKRLIRMQGELRATNHDLDEQRRKVEHALELAETANGAKSAFLANMSHELRTPLNVIIGYAEMLEEDAPDDQTRKDLRRIQESGRQLLALINDVLDLSKIEAGKLEAHVETFELRGFVEELEAAMQPLVARNGNRLAVTGPDRLGHVRADAGRLRQVLFNVLSNAAKFTHEGDVRLAVRAVDHARGELLVFEIEDTGIGIAADHLDKLFQPFVQADAATTRRYGGTGLGLAISRRLCEMMGGEIGVRSEPGVGTRFTVSVPVTWVNRERDGLQAGPSRG
ncbi:ATP-binding protein [Ramlibacter sp. AN1015]|uniref:ATP-binding protein n=1 Tax=Ramlibacter sp. AN1015 TaxID=3133428 RepID=UPI0030C5468C